MVCFVHCAHTFTSHVAGERRTSSVVAKTLLTTKEEKEANAVPRRAGATALTLHDDKCDRKERWFGHEEVWRTERPDRVTRTENEVETKICLFFSSALLFAFFLFSDGSFSVHVRFLNATLWKGHEKICVKTQHQQVKHQTGEIEKFSRATSSQRPFSQELSVPIFPVIETEHFAQQGRPMERGSVLSYA